MSAARLNLLERRRRRSLRGAARASALVGLAIACGSLESRDLRRAGTGTAESGTGGQANGSGGTHAASTSGGARARGGADFGGESGADTAGAGVGTTGGDVNEATCGNGRVEGSEQCDDGNLQPGDGCDAQCRKESCGNGRKDAGEECDPPVPNQCTSNCKLFGSRCGDGTVQADDGEQCDDGNDTANDGCTDCRLDCGDGTINAAAGEQCEPEYSTHCSDDCRWLPTCGDGDVQTEAGEECDPSNGVTCVDCKLVTPPSCDGAAGCGGAAGGCVPDADASLVQNGAFTTDASGWAPAGSVIGVSVLHDGSPAPMALEEAFASGPVRAEAGVYQCVPVRGGQSYALRAMYRLAANAPDGVGASVVGLLYRGTQCAGTYLKAFQGPLGTASDWTPYSYQFDTSALADDGGAARLLLRLDVVRPANVDGSVVDWDTVSLTEEGPHCGDCHLDAGETCDDGNLLAGDGCGSDCQLERCGDGVRQASEQCDDGNSSFGAAGDGCTPSCQTATSCDTCSAGACATQMDACFGLTGEAATGPRAGIARSSLCSALRDCVRATDCDLATRTTNGVTGAFIENCYCGTSGDTCFEAGGNANGSCRKELEAAAETTDPTLIVGRFDAANQDYPVVGAVKNLLACEGTACTDCKRTAVCGDGKLEDRNLDLNIVIDGKDVTYTDAMSATGHGVSFEECDGGSQCDANCLLVACGNYVVQAGEDCDDGNQVSGDGCSSDCKAEYVCGDGTVQAPFEDCDPPSADGSGTGCSTDQAQSSPENCACDGACKLVVCGNGILQRPYEQCDDGADNGLPGKCGVDCKLPDLGACVNCLSTDAIDGPLETTYCTSDPKCLTAQECVIDAGCFNPIPALCYCGTTDASACGADSFTPTGPCITEILAGAGGLTLGAAGTNRAALDRMTDPSYPLGVALILLNDAATPGGTAGECFPACFPPQNP